MIKLNVKQGDTVVVISGTEKGKTAKVLEVSPKTRKIVVEGVNVVTKHQKQKSQQDKGGIIKKVAPISAAKVMVICPDCGKATRVKHIELDGKNVRACKKCGATLDKEVAKKAKKQSKVETKKAPAKKAVSKVEEK